MLPSGHGRCVLYPWAIEGVADEAAPVWSPNGRYIAFLRANGLYVMRPNGRGMRRIVAAKLQDPDNPQRVWTDVRAPSWQPLPR